MININKIHLKNNWTKNTAGDIFTMLTHREQIRRVFSCLVAPKGRSANEATLRSKRVGSTRPSLWGFNL